MPILTIPVFSKTLTIEIEASNKGLWAVLMQEGRPVAFLSQTLFDRGNLSQYTRELMLIVMVVQKWGH